MNEILEKLKNNEFSYICIKEEEISYIEDLCEKLGYRISRGSYKNQFILTYLQSFREFHITDEQDTKFSNNYYEIEIRTFTPLSIKEALETKTIKVVDNIIVLPEGQYTITDNVISLWKQ